MDVIFKEFIQAIILCHNVTPIYDEGGERSFQASSPDEIALVQIAEELGFILKKRDQN